MKTNPAVSLAVILLTALTLRLAWGLSRDARDAVALRSLPDQREYLELGRNLLHRHELVMRDPRFGADVYAFRTPGYPIFIAACGGNVRAIRMVQSLLDTSTVLAIFLLAGRWLPQRCSLFAAVIVAVNPFLIYFSSLILSETLFIAMLAWGMLLLTRKPWWIGSLLLAMSVLVRPGAIALPILLALPTVFGRKSFVRVIVAAVMTVVVLFPWAWRNSRVVGAWVWTSTNAGFTMFDGFNRDASGASDQSVLAGWHDDLVKLSEVQRSEFLSALARRWIRANPEVAMVRGLKKIARTWTPMPLSKEYGGNVTLVTVALAYTIPLFVLTLIGLFRSVLSAPAKMLLLLPAIYFTLACAMSVGSLRYRLPADVPMAVVAASGLVKRRTQNAECGMMNNE